MGLKKNILTGIKAMLVKYTDCDFNNIRSAYNNRVPLPENDDYIIMTILNPERLGTPIVTFDMDKNISEQDFRLDVQIDFYGENAFDWANDIVNISRTPFLCEFLKKYSIQPISCDNATNLTNVSSERQYIDRWMLTLTIDYRDAVIVSQDGFNTAKLERLETEL